MRDYKELIQTANKAMLVKLEKNKHKNGFAGCSLQYLMRRINDEYKELKQAYLYCKLKEEAQQNIDTELDCLIYEAADVMNFCAMLILNAKERKYND